MASDSSLFQPVSRVPLSLLVARQLREAILSGELAMDSRLPTEQELTEHFGVSRSTVREALRVLQAQGLLSGGDTVSTRRPRVSSALTFASASEALENTLRLGRVPLPDLVELRLLLEGAAAASADPSRLAEARTAVGVMHRRRVDVDTFLDADVTFHISLASAGGNRAFALVMEALRESITGYLGGALRATRQPRATLRRLAAEHRAILEAIDADDGPRARQLVHAHIWDFYSRDFSG